MKQLLSTLNAHGTISQGMYIQMLKRNQGINFEIDSGMLTKLPSTLYVEEISIELSKKLIEQDEEVTSKDSLDSDTINLNKELIAKLTNIQIMLKPYMEQFKVLDITNISFVRHTGTEVLDYTNKPLTTLFIDEALLLSRSMRKDDTSRYVSMLSIDSDIRLFETLLKNKDMTSGELLVALHDGSFTEAIDSLISDLKLQLVSFGKQTTSLSKLNSMLDGDYFTIIKLFKSITEF